VPLSSLKEDVLRSECRRTIDALERWLRDLIDIVLTNKFGANYIEDAQYLGGQNVIKAEIRKHIDDRVVKEPDRFPRRIDALQLDHAINIVCRQDNWEHFFGIALKDAFNTTAEYTKALLSRIEEPRNRLAHANPISIRMAERIICYSHDTIDAIKSYLLTNMDDNEFNIAKILRIFDSFGNTGRGGCVNTHLILYPGDRFWVEVEIDPSYDESDYTIKYTATPSGMGSIPKTGNRVEIELIDSDICQMYTISFTVIMNRKWHKNALFDDGASMSYKVLPRPQSSVSV
jgi:hypothetical protein